jgi:YidC/Oxa1 family membrane protein insertase
VNPLNPVYEFVAWVLKQIYGGLSPVFGPTSGWTWALSIVLIVVLMRLIMIPLFVKQMHTTRAMSALAPEMTALRKKYKNDKQTLQQETMKLYQQAGVNPLMGCLPVVLQLPMFFALFSVLRAIAEWKPGQAPKYGLTYQMVYSARQAKILGVTVADKFLFTDGVDVPLHAKIVILVFVLASMTTTYLTVRQSMKRGMMPAATPDNPMGQSQKYMMYVMPLFALSGLYWQFGLVLYWVTTNLWTLGQQYLMFRKYPKAAAAGAAGAAGTAIAPGVTGRTVTTRPKRAVTSRPGSGAPAASPASQDGPAGSNGAAAPGAADQTGRGAPNGAQPAQPAQPAKQGRKGAGAPAGRRAPAAAGSGKTANRARQASQPSANGGGVLRRLGKRAEPAPPPPEPEVKLVRQQKQRQSRSKRSGKR